MVDLNPFDILKLRKTDYLPVHFKTYNLKDMFFDNTIERWIYTNLKGRFYLGERSGFIDDRIKIYDVVGFEEEKELTFFMLACPHLKEKL